MKFFCIIVDTSMKFLWKPTYKGGDMDRTYEDYIQSLIGKEIIIYTEETGIPGLKIKVISKREGYEKSQFRVNVVESYCKFPDFEDITDPKHQWAYTYSALTEQLASGTAKIVGGHNA